MRRWPGGGRLLAASAISRSPFSQRCQEAAKQQRSEALDGGGAAAAVTASIFRLRCTARGQKTGGACDRARRDEHRTQRGEQVSERDGGGARERVRRGPREGGAVGAQNPSRRRRPPVCDSCVCLLTAWRPPVFPPHPGHRPRAPAMGQHWCFKRRRRKSDSCCPCEASTLKKQHYR